MIDEFLYRSFDWQRLIDHSVSSLLSDVLVQETIALGNLNIKVKLRLIQLKQAPFSHIELLVDHLLLLIPMTLTPVLLYYSPQQQQFVNQIITEVILP